MNQAVSRSLPHSMVSLRTARDPLLQSDMILALWSVHPWSEAHIGYMIERISLRFDVSTKYYDIKYIICKIYD